MRANNRTARKNKGQIALYFPKWHYTTATNPKRQQRAMRANSGGNLK